MLAFGAGAPPIKAQQGCPPPPFMPSAKVHNIFNERQQMDLGDAQAEHVQRYFRVIDDQVTEYVQRIGDRLTARLPKSETRYRFLLVDVPIANAFTLAGGRVYVTRKLVAQTRNEDELAGVLGHEIGHNLMGDIPIRYTNLFEKVLGVTEVGDRKDVFEKYNRVIDNAQRKAGAFKQKDREEQEGQLDADRAGIYLVAQAGYLPQAAGEFWNRTQEVKGKTGSGLSDFFGFTKPEQKRLREMLKMAEALPSSCQGPPSAPSAETYQKWQAAVVAYSGLGRKESLHALLAKKSLEPPLEDDINHLKFSANGRYILAQDDSSIYVLSRDPFATLFRIDAPDAFPAQFTPDGESVVFHRPDLRVERWNIEEEQQADVKEMAFNKGCLQTGLSPDGKFLVCVSGDFDLLLYDVASGQQVFQKKEFWMPTTINDLVMLILLRFAESNTFNFIRSGFSPDAHYFVAARGDSTLALDLTTMAPISLPGSVKKYLKRTFAFMGPDRLIGVNQDDSKGPAVLMKFPAGEEISRVDVGAAMLSAPSHGNFILLRPIDKYPVGVMNLETRKIFLANKNVAMDVYDDVSVSQRRSGTLGLFSTGATAPVAEVALPRSTLGTIRASALSTDMRYVALSQRSRGGVWDIERGERMFHVRGFRGAYFSDDGIVYADFPKFQESERGIARLHLASRQVLDGPKIEERDAEQYGEFIVLLKPKKKDASTQRDVTFEVQDARTGNILWSRAFPKERPASSIGTAISSMVLVWSLETGHAKDEIKNDPALKARLAAMKEKEGDYYLEVVEARTGKTLRKMLVETGKGSFRIERTYAVGDYVVIVDTSNRVLVYSLSSGEQKGKVFGTRVAVSGAGNLLCVENETGQLAVYDIARMEKRDQFIFSHPVSFLRFSADGKRLFVLTNDQTTYVLDVTAAAAAAANR